MPKSVKNVKFTLKFRQFETFLPIKSQFYVNKNCTIGGGWPPLLEIYTKYLIILQIIFKSIEDLL